MKNKMHILQRILSATLVSLIFVQSSLPALAVEQTNINETKMIFVSLNGDDTTGDGSINKPFKTFVKARDAAKTLHTSNNQVYVYVRGGKYFFDKPLELTPVDSNVTYSAYNDEDVEISGSQTLTNLIWSDYSKNTNIKVTQLQPGLGIDQLFVNKMQQVMARYPNYVPDKIPLGGVTDQSTIKTHSAKWSDPTTGYIRALHSNGWGGNDYFITKKNQNSVLGVDVRWIGDNNRGSEFMSTAVVAENIFEELDTQNEWFYDNKTGKLYFYPDFDINIHDQSLTVEATTNSDLLNIKGYNYTNPIHDVTFSNFNFTNTKRSMFISVKQYIPLLRGDWCVQKAGAVYIENGKNINIANSNFINMGGNAIFMYGYNANNQIYNNEMLNLGASGVQVIGNTNSIDDPSFWQSQKTTVKHPTQIGPISENYPRDIVISNNHIENIGVYEKQSAGVNLSVSSRIKILHNTIHMSARSNINVNDGTFGGHEIAYNDLYDSQRETTDHGPFNSWGRDRYWSVPSFGSMGENGDIKRNYTNDGVNYYDITQIDAYQTTKIHDNRLQHSAGQPHTWGIDLDDGSSNYEVYNNLCLGLGIKLREGFNRKVYNNIILDGKLEIHVSYKEAKDTVYGNIVYNSDPWSYMYVDQTRFTDAQYTVDKNWYYNNGSSINLPSWYHANLSSSSTDANALINVDPGFVNPKANGYTVTNTEAMNAIGFKNIPMDEFGKPSCTCKSPIYAKVSSGTTPPDVLQNEIWMGATISGIDDSIISVTGSFGYNGVYFKSVPANSEAYKTGFRTNDVLKSVNNITLSDKESFHTEFTKIQMGMLAIMEVYRTNKMQTFSFINSQTPITVLDCNDQAVTYSTTLTDDLWTTNAWYYDTRQYDTEQANTLTAYRDASQSNDAWFDVNFTGTNIEYYSRKFPNQGTIQVTITNKDTNQVVDNQTIDCNSSNYVYQTIMYSSPTLPQGNYVLHAKKLSGDYMTVDYFNVISNTVSNNSIYAKPTSITYAGAIDANELKSGQTLNYATSFYNTSNSDINAKVQFALYTVNNGTLSLNDLKTKLLCLKSTQITNVTDNYTLPNDVSNKLLCIMVTDETGNPISYATTIKDSNLAIPSVSISNSTPDNDMNISYDSLTYIVSLTAAGVKKDAQTTLFVSAGDQTIMINQAKATDTKVGYNFQLPSTFIKQDVTFKVCSENSDPIIKVFTITPIEISLNKTNVELEVGSTLTLTASTNLASTNSIIWTTSDNSVATVSNGIIMANQAGTAIIKASMNGKEASCTVTVKNKTVNESSAQNSSQSNNSLNSQNSTSSNDYKGNINKNPNTGNSNMELIFLLSVFACATLKFSSRNRVKIC
jgi:hypothetical protein